MTAAVAPLRGAVSVRDISVTEAVLGRVRAACRRRLAWLGHVQGSAAGSSPRATVALALDNLDDPEAEAAWYASAPEAAAATRELAAYSDSLERDEASPLRHVVRVFALSPEERDVLHVCLALDLEPGLSSTFALLQAHPERSHVTSSLVARLFGWKRARLFSEASTLHRWQIVTAAEGGASGTEALAIDPQISLFIQGRAGRDSRLVDIARPVAPREPLPAWPVLAVAERLRAALAQGATVRCAVLGPRGSGRRTFAACVVARLGAGLLAVDSGELSEAEWPAVYLRAQRHAALSGDAIVWLGSHAFRRPPTSPAVCPLQFVIGDVESVAQRADGVMDERVLLPSLGLEERRGLWRRFVAASVAWRPGELDQVVERYRVTVGDIAAIGGAGVTQAGEVRELCRSLTRDRLSDLGHLLECPFSRADLTVSTKLGAVLDEFLFEAREHAIFWEAEAARRLFPRGRGLIALMTGPPGTGKTMAAQVIAGDLDLDLFRIDVAASVSKYIGETAKNLQRIFARAREMNAVLFFDEADALFSRRTEVKDSHDRYANTDTNYLLQLLEDFPGIGLLASNKKQNIDPAFVRRLRYVMEFSRPQASERRSIWGRLVTELSGTESEQRLERDLDALATSLDLTGAQIKLAVLTALFVARQAREPLGLPHLLRGVDRELMKDGRSLAESEKKKVERHAR